MMRHARILCLLVVFAGCGDEPAKADGPKSRLREYNRLRIPVTYYVDTVTGKKYIELRDDGRFIEDVATKF